MSTVELTDLLQSTNLLGYTGSRGIDGSAGIISSNTAPVDTSALWYDTASQGQSGYTGSQGTAGFTGSQGSAGFTGSQGLMGYTGSSGAGTPGAGGTGLTLRTIQTANFTAITGNVYPIDTRLNPVTVTLPASPTAGDIVGFIDYAGTWSSNSVTVNRNSSNIAGLASNPVYAARESSVQLIYIDANQGWKTYNYSTTPIPSLVPSEILIVAGGGGGVDGRTGGGGAGGLLYYGTESPKTPNGSELYFVRNSNYLISIGAGGTSTDGASQGSNSSISGPGIDIAAIGGGGGGGGADTNSGRAGGNGGSGGGGGGNSQGNGLELPGGKGIYPGSSYLSQTRQGYDGGSAFSASGSPGGGGGGAGAAGSNAGGGPGAGGAGLQYSITGSATYYGGGGGGGSFNVGTANGGLGGGGNGGNQTTASTAGTANTGGGGGGRGVAPASAGGSGVVIFAYPDIYPNLTVSAGLSYTLDTVSRTGYKIYRFTAGTGTISW